MPAGPPEPGPPLRRFLLRRLSVKISTMITMTMMTVTTMPTKSPGPAVGDVAFGLEVVPVVGAVDAVGPVEEAIRGFEVSLGADA